MVQKNTELPFQRLRVVQSLSDFQLTGIHRGIIIIFAAWSPLAIMSVRRVTRILARLDAGSLEIVVLDNDCMSGADMTQLFGHVFHGHGECLWIRDGRVVAELSAAPAESENSVLTYTKGLIDDLG